MKDDFEKVLQNKIYTNRETRNLINKIKNDTLQKM